jgi:hypothetical protein
VTRAALVALALALAACAPSGVPPSPPVDQAALIDFRQVTALRRDRTADLQALLADTSFLIARIGGRREYYLAPGGRAVIRDTQLGTTEAGAWQVVPARIGDDLVCWTPGRFPQEMAGRALVDLCRSVGEFVGLAFSLSRGDQFGLSGALR